MSTHKKRPYRQVGVFLPHVRDTEKPDTDEQGPTLPKQTYFPQLEFWQRLSDNSYSLYFQHHNGGTLEDLIQKYRRARTPIPETFVWHVAVELGKALAYLHQAPPGILPGWWRIRHRGLTADNVFVHYEGTENGNRYARGTPKNAFPQIVLGGFGRAARTDEPQAELRPSAMIEEFAKLTAVFGPAPEAAAAPSAAAIAVGPNAVRSRWWEDVYQYGGLLRRLVQAHLPGADAPPEAWTVEEACFWGLIPGQSPHYSEELQEWLSSNFEYDNMDTSDIFQSQTINGVTEDNYRRIGTMQQLLDDNWAQNLTQAQECLDAARRELGAIYTGPANVSWTQPPHLMACPYFDEDDEELRGLDRWSTARGRPGPLRPLRAHRELRRVEWQVPKLYPVDERTDVRYFGQWDDEGDFIMGGV
ncbi:hypothetical protein PG991_011874 [Apiospora marii]|uniref:non-specific serine/threonine protein kinase n=2 Tax=Apiospora marii TaxID=335849 RepID=A0ABR1RFE7_9PEZI